MATSPKKKRRGVQEEHKQNKNTWGGVQVATWSKISHILVLMKIRMISIIRGCLVEAVLWHENSIQLWWAQSCGSLFFCLSDRLTVRLLHEISFENSSKVLTVSSQRSHAPHHHKLLSIVDVAIYSEERAARVTETSSSSYLKIHLIWFCNIHIIHSHIFSLIFTSATGDNRRTKGERQKRNSGHTWCGGEKLEHQHQ